MEKIKNVKSIQIKGELEGRGIVNFDSKEQRYAISAFNLTKEMGAEMLHDNIKLGKKSFKYEGKKTITINKEGDTKEIDSYSYKNLISSACLRHATYQNDVEMVNSAIMQSPVLLSTYETSFVGLTRGYMFAQKPDAPTPSTKRTSCLTLTDAIQKKGAKSVLSVGTTMGARDEKSLTYQETVGDIEYDFKGNIDVKNLQFISSDLFYDRLSIYPDWINNGMFDDCMKKHYGDKAQYKAGHFTHQAQYLTKTICENGVLLSNDFTVYLIKETLKRLLRIYITRSTAYAKLKSLKIRLTDDILMGEDEGWITIKSDEDIDNLDFSIFEYFVESTNEDFEERNRLEKEYESVKEDKKKKKEEEKAARDAAKKAKAAKDKSNEVTE